MYEYQINIYLDKRDRMLEVLRDIELMIGYSYSLRAVAIAMAPSSCMLLERRFNFNRLLFFASPSPNAFPPIGPTLLEE